MGSSHHQPNTALPARPRKTPLARCGMSQSPSNFRNRTMTRAMSHANTLLAERDEISIPLGLTPRSLRRTFAPLLYALGHDPV
jgi:hypothetical protein